MWTQRDTLDSLLWEAVIDDAGIYPRAVIRDGVETPRTEWQDGWNAAVMDFTNKHADFAGWVRALSGEQRTQLQALLDSDSEPVRLAIRDGAVSLNITCGDTFAYACADSEPFPLDALGEIHRLWSVHGYYGLVAWIARERHAEPVKEYRHRAGYLAAKADLAPLPQSPAVGRVTDVDDGREAIAAPEIKTPER